MGNSTHVLSDITHQLGARFSIKDMDNPYYFFGIEVTPKLGDLFDLGIGMNGIFVLIRP